MNISMSEEKEDVTHEGGCHCGAVRWQLRAPPILDCIKCNCSICKKKSNDHYIVKIDRFKLLQGDEKLTTYRFQHGQCSAQVL
ncbi:unnamed protein product [Caenorhabditis auriculariae]|uniref:CENP-V/GFA domain-containing protein n=1 Tax=Caenorhabditis auriculariae TaxID=2777116 RepID=A0A8S1HFR9_9PELO|nr:unnamed protein product [Caenorhabditis auriculariae]